MTVPDTEFDLVLLGATVVTMDPAQPLLSDSAGKWIPGGDLPQIAL